MRVSKWLETPLIQNLREHPRLWLVTGAAGFIGSNLVECLLRLGQQVRGLDNLSTGHMGNLDRIQAAIPPQQWQNFTWIQGDIRDSSVCAAACQGARHVLHQAALGSVPRSIESPIHTHEANTTGFLNMLVAGRDAEVDSFVYAASSSTYGDHPDLPKIEDRIGRPLSPYAVTKLVNELYADVFGRTYGFHSIGLRYFNVFGPRQDPHGAYAAVVPTWFATLLAGESVFINGDGETSRDFCYVDNVVQANLLAALTQDSAARGQIYNVAFGQSTTLNRLFQLIVANLAELGKPVDKSSPTYRDFRAGDVRHSLADISKAQRLLGYAPEFSVEDGLRQAARWYLESAFSVA